MLISELVDSEGEHSHTDDSAPQSPLPLDEVMATISQEDNHMLMAIINQAKQMEAQCHRMASRFRVTMVSEVEYMQEQTTHSKLSPLMLDIMQNQTDFKSRYEKHIDRFSEMYNRIAFAEFELLQKLIDHVSRIEAELVNCLEADDKEMLARCYQDYVVNHYFFEKKFFV